MALDIETLLIKHTIDYEILDNKIKDNLLKSWRKKYSIKLHNQTSQWIFNGKDWHVFSFNYSNHLEGTEAEKAYKNNYIKSYYLMSSNEKIPPILCNSMIYIPVKEIKDFLFKHTEYYDLYIFHHNMKWTFIITHEIDFGPYYSDKP